MKAATGTKTGWWLSAASAGLLMLGGLSVTSAPVQAETMSDWLGGQLKAEVKQQFDADLYYETLDLNTLLAQLSATDIRLQTNIAELEAGLNQAVIAEELLLEGDWQSAAQNNLQLDSAVITNAQITVAYFAKGRSNLHVLLEKAEKMQVRKANEPLVWAVNEVVFRNVVVNLFDNGMPLASVQLDELVIDNLNSQQTADERIQEVLWPILNQVGERVLSGQGSDMQVDTQRFMRFLWREM